MMKHTGAKRFIFHEEWRRSGATQPSCQPVCHSVALFLRKFLPKPVFRTRSCSRILRNQESGNEMNRSEKGAVKFVVARGDPAKVFKFVEEALDAIALAVELRVVA